MSVLDLPIHGIDGAATIGEFFAGCLHMIVLDGHAFTPEMSMDSLGWEYTLAEALVGAGLIDGEWEPDGESLVAFDHSEWVRVLRAAIDERWWQTRGG